MTFRCALVALSTALLSSNAGFASDDLPPWHEICEARLGRATANDLATAVATGEYGFDLLSATVGGRERSILLLGETHLKSGAASRAGRALIARFRAIAVEGAPIVKLWGGRLIKGLIDSAESAIQKKGGSLSTIDDVRSEKFYGGPTEVFQLEKGHRVTRREKFGGLVLLGQTFLPAAACVTSACWLGLAAVAAPGQLVPAGIAMGLSLASALTFYVAKVDWLVGLFLGKPRDPTMTKNIVKILEDHPEVDELMVVVGAKHLPGIRKRLQRLGFVVEISLPRPRRQRVVEP